VILACWRLMQYDVKISGARIRTHDIWIRNRVCYLLYRLLHHTDTPQRTTSDWQYTIAMYWLAPRPVDFRQLRPCTRLESTAIPQIQLCGVHSGTPRRRDTAMRMDVLSRSVPTEGIVRAMACRNAPEAGAAAAIRWAWLAWVWAADNTASAAITYRGWPHVFWLAAIDRRIWCWFLGDRLPSYVNITYLFKCISYYSKSSPKDLWEGRRHRRSVETDVAHTNIE